MMQLKDTYIKWKLLHLKQYLKYLKQKISLMVILYSSLETM